jgi:hypothetical protein
MESTVRLVNGDEDNIKMYLKEISCRVTNEKYLCRTPVPETGSPD